MGNVKEALKKTGLKINSKEPTGKLLSEKINNIGDEYTPTPVPTGKITITSTNEVDVTDYALAQVVDENLIAGNIKKDISILGITGILESGISQADFLKLKNTLINDLHLAIDSENIEDLIDELPLFFEELTLYQNSKINGSKLLEFLEKYNADSEFSIKIQTSDPLGQNVIGILIDTNEAPYEATFVLSSEIFGSNASVSNIPVTSSTAFDEILSNQDVIDLLNNKSALDNYSLSDITILTLKNNNFFQIKVKPIEVSDIFENAPVEE